MRFVEDALDRGARLIVIDPRRTQSAESAERVIQIRPGTDGALALGVAHQLLVGGHIDETFVQRHVHGLNEFAAMATHFTPARVAETTGVPEAEILALADAVAEVSPMTICAGFGMQRFTNSGQTMRALIALLALTGNIGKPGAGWVYANLQSQIFSTPRDPLALFPPERDKDAIRVSISTTRLGRDIVAQNDPPITTAWIERGNPVTQNPHTSSVLNALRGLDFRVVVDQFFTDTAREADLVLPAKTLFEQTDVINAYWHDYIQIKDKLIEPPGEVLPESEIYRRLALRLGFDPRAVTETLPGPGDAEVEAYLEKLLEPWPELTLESLRRGPRLTPGHREIAFADLVFPTPSGKIELHSSEAAERWEVNELPRYSPPLESPGRNEAAAFPLHLLTPNTKDRIHSQFNNLPSIRRINPKTTVDIHPADAEARAIADGDLVRVFNNRGAVEIEARIDHGIRPGCVSVSNGWWLCEGGGINLLSSPRETDMAHGAAFHDNAVEVEPTS
jgi:anaerobic selenocysteine-containing dehydrogenase